MHRQNAPTFRWCWIISSNYNKLNKPVVFKLDHPHGLEIISRKPARILLTNMSPSPLNRISHGYCRFQGQSHPVGEASAPSLVHMGVLGLSFLPASADPGRQSRWPWPVSQVHTLWRCIARAAATGPGSLCQLVPDLSDSQAHSHVCHGGHQRWHEVLIRPPAPHPTEGVSDSSISCHAPVTAALWVPDVLFVSLAPLPEDWHW